jgi:hypothetical protein
MGNCVYNKKQITQELNKILEEIEFVLTNSKNVFCSKKTNFNQILVHLLDKNDNLLSKEIIKIIIDLAYRSEMHGANSFKTFLSAIINLRKIHGLISESVSITLLEEFYQANDRLVAANKSNIDLLIQTSEAQERTKNIFYDILELSGGSSKIILEKSEKESIQIINGFNFPLSNLFDITKWKYSNVKILLIDGLIDSVGEIDHIMTYYAKTKEPLLIFARGFHDEVILTLRTNFNRNTLNIIPIRVDYDLEGANTLKDLAVVCGADVISSLKGDVISLIKPDDIMAVTSVDMTINVVTIIENRTTKDVKKNLEMILEKQADEQIMGVESIYDKRMKTMVPNCTIVRLNDEKILFELDSMNRMLKSAIQFGLITNFPAENLNKIIDEFVILPVTSVYFPLKYALEFYKNINNIGIFIG